MATDQLGNVALPMLAGGEDELLPGRDLLEVARYFVPTEAHIVQGCLAASGVPAVVADANLVQTNSLWTAALGGVRILVPESFLAQAQAIIAAFERGDYQLNENDDVSGSEGQGQ
ncbi:MAG: DUF2007 domain-containing protein [Pseudomonadota bacterium]